MTGNAADNDDPQAPTARTQHGGAIARCARSVPRSCARLATAMCIALLSVAIFVACSDNADTVPPSTAAAGSSTSPTGSATATQFATQPPDTTATMADPTSTRIALPTQAPTDSTPTTSATTEASPTPSGPTPTIPIATHGNAEIYVINADGTDERRLTNAITSESMPQWSPDGSRIAYGNASAQHFPVEHIVSTHLDGSGQDELLPANDFGYEQFAWLPDNRLAYASCNDRHGCGTFTADIGATNLVQLPNDVRYEQMAWSPDGTRVAYIDRSSGNTNLAVRSLTDNSVRLLTDTARWEWTPAWSPDGRSLAYARAGASGSSSELFVIEVDEENAEPHFIYTSPDGLHEPAWSPDGTQLVFIRGYSRQTDLWVINVDGSELRQLTNAPHSERDPVWSPDGSQIAFTSTRDGGQPVMCSFGTDDDIAPARPMEGQAVGAHSIVVGTITEAILPFFAPLRDPDVSEVPEIISDYLLTVEAHLGGADVGSTVRLRTYGGTIGDCVQDISSSPELKEGDRLLLFLNDWVIPVPEYEPPHALYPSKQSIWEITPNDTIVSPEHADNPDGYDGMTLDEVRDLVDAALAGAP